MQVIPHLLSYYFQKIGYLKKMTESHDIERYHLDICCRLLFRFFDNYEPIDFGNDCQASPRAVQLPERIDELDRSLLAVVTAVLIAKMDNANLVAYLCIWEVRGDYQRLAYIINDY